MTSQPPQSAGNDDQHRSDGPGGPPQGGSPDPAWAQPARPGTPGAPVGGASPYEGGGATGSGPTGTGPTGSVPTGSVPTGSGSTASPPSGAYGPPSGAYGPPSGTYGPPSGTYGSPDGYTGQPGSTYGPAGAGGPSSPYGYPGHAGPGSGPSGGSPTLPVSSDEAKSFFAALFDFTFTRRATPKIVQVVYLLIALATLLGYLAYSIAAFSANAAVGVFVLLIIGPVVALATLAFWRLTLELYLSVSHMADDIRQMRARGK
jgi:hypothetical protein